MEMRQVPAAGGRAGSVGQQGRGGRRGGRADVVHTSGNRAIRATALQPYECVASRLAGAGGYQP